jgi:hypothetical protein
LIAFRASSDIVGLWLKWSSSSLEEASMSDGIEEDAVERSSPSLGAGSGGAAGVRLGRM